MGIFMRKIWEKYEKELRFTGIAVLIFLGFRYLFVYISPFLIAYLICQGISPGADFLHRRFRIPVTVGGILILLIIIGLLGTFLYYGLSSACSNLVAFSQDAGRCLPAIERDFCDRLCALEQKLHLEKGMLLQMAGAGWSKVKCGISEKWVPGILPGAVTCVRFLGGVFAYLLVILVAVILLLKDWKHMQSAFHQKMQRIGGNLLSFLGIYLWAEIRIMIAVGLTCLLGLLVAGVKKAPFLAVLTAFLDVLPFVGTGIVLVPALLWQFFTRNYRAAVIIGITYLCCILAREFLEPKLISRKAGISPLLTLAGLYMGIYAFGLAGIFLGPVYVLVVTMLYRQMFCNS